MYRHTRPYPAGGCPRHRLRRGSRDFKGLAGNDDDDDAKGFAVNLDGVPVLFGGDGPDIIRPGRGGDIIVVRFFSHE